MRPLALVMVLLILVPFSHALSPGDPGFRGCVMLIPEGQFDDTDCDDVPDVVDNCPLSANHEQADVDANGLGDACDLVIDEIVIEPAEPMQGRSVLVKIGIFNNRPYEMRNMIAKVEVPRIGITASEHLRPVRPGERTVQEVLLRIPVCAPPQLTEFVAIAEYPVAPGEKEVFSNVLTVPVRQSGACPHDPGSSRTVVDIVELQDVHPEKGAVYPFTIKNNWPESKAYVLTTKGHESWGTVTIEPGSVIVVPAGGTREGLLHLFAREGQSGEKGFTLTVQARDDIEQVLLQAKIPQPPRKDPAGSQLLVGLLAFLGILGLIALVIVFLKGKHGRSVEEWLKRQAPKPRKKPRKKKSTGRR